MPFAHIGSLPVEETFASACPALVVVLGGATARLRSRATRRRDNRRATHRPTIEHRRTRDAQPHDDSHNHPA
jgi:hypothetical protein